MIDMQSLDVPVNYLAMQITELHCILVNQAKAADASRSKVQGCGRPQTSSAYDQSRSTAQPILCYINRLCKVKRQAIYRCLQSPAHRASAPCVTGRDCG